MRTLFLTLTLAFSLQPSALLVAQTNILTGNVADYGLVGKRANVTLTLRWPNPRTYNNVLIVQDPVATRSDADGDFSFTNILWGSYDLTISGQRGTPFKIFVGTNTIGTVQIASLVTNSAALPPNIGTNYYTIAQADAIHAGLGNGSGFPLTEDTDAGNYGLTNLGSLQATGAVTAAAFVGDGSGLTGIVASSTNPVPAYVITNNQSTAVTLADDLTVEGTITGNAAGLTNIPLIINAEDYGVVAGAAAAQVGPGLQAALNAAKNGSVVLLPPGLLNITGYLIAVTNNGCTLRGSGPFQTYLYTTSTTVSGISNKSSLHVTFENFTLYKPSPDATSTTAGFIVQNSPTSSTSGSRATFRNLRVSGFYSGFLIDHVTGAVFENVDAYQNVIGFNCVKVDASTWIGCFAGDGMDVPGSSAFSAFGAFTNSSRGWFFGTNSAGLGSLGNSLVSCEGRRAARVLDVQNGWVTVRNGGWEYNTSNFVYVGASGFVTIDTCRFASQSIGNNLIVCASGAADNLVLINSQMTPASGYYSVQINESGTAMPGVVGQQTYSLTNVATTTALTLTDVRVVAGSNITVATNGNQFTIASTASGSGLSNVTETASSVTALTNFHFAVKPTYVTPSGVTNNAPLADGLLAPLGITVIADDSILYIDTTTLVNTNTTGISGRAITNDATDGQMLYAVGTTEAKWDSAPSGTVDITGLNDGENTGVLSNMLAIYVETALTVSGALTNGTSFYGGSMNLSGGLDSQDGATFALSVQAADAAATNQLVTLRQYSLGSVATATNLAGGALGTPSSGNLTNCTNYAASALVKFPVDIGLACSTETNSLTASTNVVRFLAPFAFTLTNLFASVNTAPTGTPIIVQVFDADSNSFPDANLTIPVNAYWTNETSMSVSAVTNRMQIVVNINQVGSTVAGAGLKLWLQGYR